MVQKRKRIAETGRPNPCLVLIQPTLAAALYRETILQTYRDETELVNDIIRNWVKEKGAADWPEVLKLIRQHELEKAKT